MVLGFIGTFLLWVFFLYGIIAFIHKIFYEIGLAKRKEKNRGKILLIVQNQEENIELILRILHHHGIEVDVIDYHSSDATREIVKKLSLDLETIHWIDREYGKVEG